MSLSVQDQRLIVIARVQREWALEQAGKVKPDRKYARAGRSQYPEGVEALSASDKAQADLKSRTDEALREAGLPVSW